MGLYIAFSILLNVSTYYRSYCYITLFFSYCERKYIFFVPFLHQYMLPVLTILNENNHNFLRFVSPYCVLEMKNSLSCVQYNTFNWEEEEITSDISNTFSRLPLSSGPDYNKSIVNLTMDREGRLDLLMGPLKKKDRFVSPYRWFRSATLIYWSRRKCLRLFFILYQIIKYFQFNCWRLGYWHTSGVLQALPQVKVVKIIECGS